jgi:hypothetical protein
VAAEPEMLEEWLEFPRTTLLLKCEGVHEADLHMIEEYARHNGHADLIRELIDGEVGY